MPLLLASKTHRHVVVDLLRKLCQEVCFPYIPRDQVAGLQEYFGWLKDQDTIVVGFKVESDPTTQLMRFTFDITQTVGPETKQ